ncbi:hypothetical protein BV898_05395 [Hypsibius exemplaris]|uniref:G-protein coupled receptors family 1 profile domain-containing protein n=1 Tax=Hypsibius exemplaris TaxID=2072580 RepID=A0A1W0WZE8_HYPEX|nr:hypothetical protein BV898_05395 [Hypsibius exemplaris]
MGLQLYWDPSCNNRTVEFFSGQTFTDYVDRVTFPIFFLACIIGSILTILVMSRRAAESRGGTWYLTNAIICSLAVGNILAMIWETGQFCVDLNRSLNNHSLNTDVISPGWESYLEATSRWGRECSLTLCNWLLICFSVERIISLKSSKKRVTLMQFSRTRSRAACVFLLVSLHAVISPLPYLLDDIRYYSATGSNTTYIQPDWLSEWLDIQFYLEMVFISGTFLMLLATLLVTVVLLRRCQQARQKWEKEGLRRHSLESLAPKYFNSFSMSAVFFITQTPVLVRNIIMQLDKNCFFNISGMSRKESETVVVMIARLNYCLAFFVYLTFDPKFRSHTKLLFKETFGLIEDRKIRRRDELLRQLKLTKESDGIRIRGIDSSQL